MITVDQAKKLGASDEDIRQMCMLCQWVRDDRDDTMTAVGSWKGGVKVELGTTVGEVLDKLEATG